MPELKIQLGEPQKLTAKLSEPQSLSLGMGAQPVIRDYNHLQNLPSINGVQLKGDKTPEDLFIVSENTKEGWQSMPTYVPKKGEICIFTNAVVREQDGVTVNIPAFKIGDGSAYIADLPYMADGNTGDKLNQHLQDAVAHVTQEEKDFWSNTLNYVITGENLVLNRL